MQLLPLVNFNFEAKNFPEIASIMTVKTVTGIFPSHQIFAGVSLVKEQKNVRIFIDSSNYHAIFVVKRCYYGVFWYENRYFSVE